ncbi:hypothetical protein [Hansschlegelia sp.]|uniref:hypothetical protein n=1 Tax=Hansschlegelia sp. TaxID=2041892 RepID=UPI002C511CCA|nr:hypothetical protein [Hansschlegelia sp.]HVI27479.1 hypothetical protein [Hansschlegelia sp.]
MIPARPENAGGAVVSALVTDAPADESEFLAMPQQQFCDRFVTRMTAAAGFSHFADGMAVEDYARQTAASYWADECYRRDGPEACAEGDMSYWGED